MSGKPEGLLFSLSLAELCAILIGSVRFVFPDEKEFLGPKNAEKPSLLPSPPICLSRPPATDKNGKNANF